MTTRRVFALLAVIAATVVGPTKSSAPLQSLGVPGAFAQAASPPVERRRSEATPDPAAAREVALPEYSGYVNDLASVLDASTRAKLEAFLDQLARKTGAQFAVLIVPRTAPLAPAEYKVRVFEKWGIGKSDEDLGLLMLVAIEERRVEFETGYGLEGTLPDGLQSRIVRREVAPRFRDGDYAGGITAGVLRSAERIASEKGVKLEWDGRELRYSGQKRTRVRGVFVALLMFIVILIIVSSISQSTGGPGPFGGRRRHGWDAGWGGGFGGGLGGGWGGGLGGGGGGGSFGGFGGGGSGGGGGGGSW